MKIGALAGKYISDIVFGANDGIVTTFAIVAGAAGAHLSPFVVLALGFANLIGDGISMGLGEYLGRKSERAYYRGELLREEREVRTAPNHDVVGIRRIFHRWGFRGKELQHAVTVVRKNPRAWADLLVQDQLGGSDAAEQPFRRGFVMFVAFVIFGFVPLLSFLFGGNNAFTASIVFSACSLFALGASRSRFTPIPWWRGGLEMLLIGTTAGLTAYLIGVVINSLVR